MSPDSDALRPRRDVLDTLWRIGSAPAAVVLLFGAVGLLLGLAAVFPQPPTGLDAAATERWLAATAQSHGEAGPLLRALGVFDVSGGVALRILLAALAFSLFLRLAMEVQEAIRAYAGRAIAPAAASSGAVRQVSLPGPLAERWPAIEAVMRDRYPDVVVRQAGGLLHLHGRRGRSGTIGQVLLCLGLLVVLGGLLVNSSAGWRTGDLAVGPHRDAVISGLGGMDVRLNGIEGDGGATVVSLTLTRLDGRTFAAQVAATRPARWGNLWLRLRGTGPALIVNGRDQGGKALLVRSLESADEAREEVSLLFQQTQTEQGVVVPAQSDLTLRAVSYDALPEKGIPGPVFLVEAYRGDDAVPIVSQLVENEAQLRVEDATYTLRRGRYALVEAFYLPGLIPVLAGAGIALLGALLAWAVNHAQAWVEAADGGTATVLMLSVSALRRRGAELDLLVRRLEAA